MADADGTDAQEETTANAGRQARGRRGHSLLAAAAGFILGAVVWHFVGFWAFVSSIVLHGPEAARMQQASFAPTSGTTAVPPLSQARAPFTTRHRQVGAARQPTCSTAVIDRRGGVVTLGNCKPMARRFALQSAGRSDRGVAAPMLAEPGGGGWIVQVDARRDN